MRMRISAFVGISLDGFLADRDGTVDFLRPYEKLERGYTAFFASIDTLVIGRRTHDFVRAMLAGGLAWPYEGKRTIVMTHHPLPAIHGERAFAGEPAALVAALEREGARHLYVDGGQVIRAFLAAGLLDDLTITIVPALV